MITHDYLLETYNYDPKTGFLTWAKKISDKVNIGSRAGSLHKQRGYRYVRINKKAYSEHRVIWFYLTKNWPTAIIDHINGIKDDNRKTNLRDISLTDNQRNQRTAHRHNITGVLGVVFHKKNKNYVAQIVVNRKTIYLGSYDSIDAASIAYQAAKRLYHKLPFVQLIDKTLS